MVRSISNFRRTVPELCQNSICIPSFELLFEPEQLPQVVDNRHFTMELMYSLEPVTLLHTQGFESLRAHHIFCRFHRTQPDAPRRRSDSGGGPADHAAAQSVPLNSRQNFPSQHVDGEETVSDWDVPMRSDAFLPNCGGIPGLRIHVKIDLLDTESSSLA
jgi:hypothetical protein